MIWHWFTGLCKIPAVSIKCCYLWPKPVLNHVNISRILLFFSSFLFCRLKPIHKQQFPLSVWWYRCSWAGILTHELWFITNSCTQHSSNSVCKFLSVVSSSISKVLVPVQRNWRSSVWQPSIKDFDQSYKNQSILPSLTHIQISHTRYSQN